MGRLVLVTCIAALLVFAVVQDRLTAAGARSYVQQQRARIEAGQPPVAVADVMQPAVGASVRTAAVSAGAVLIVGILVAVARRRREK